MKVSIIYHSETGNTAKMAELVSQGCLRVPEIETKCMSVEEMDDRFLEQSRAVIFGSPTHDGTLSWQLKKCIRDAGRETFAGKLGAVFVSQNWPGGGGASFAEMTIIAIMLVKGMLIYSGGIVEEGPDLHFGAVSYQEPEDELYVQRCITLGENVAKKTMELFR